MIKDYLINIRKHIPYVGKLADERDLLLKERNKLLYELGRSKQERKEERPSDVMNDLKKRKSVKILKRDKLLMDVSLGKIKIKNKFYINNIKKYLNGKHNIFDIGSGPKGSYWWNYVDKE